MYFGVMLPERELTVVRLSTIFNLHPPSCSGVLIWILPANLSYHEAIIPRELWLEVQQILKGENVVPVPSVDEVADLSASDVPQILDGFFVIKPRKDGNNEYLRQL